MSNVSEELTRRSLSISMGPDRSQESLIGPQRAQLVWVGSTFLGGNPSMVVGFMILALLLIM